MVEFSLTCANVKHKAPSIRTAKLHGKKAFLVTWPNPNGNRPFRKFFSFDRKQEAEAFLAVRKVEFENFGKAAFTIPEALRADALRAAELLLPTGKTVLDAAKFFLDHWQRQTQGKPIAEAVEAFLRDRSSRSKGYLAVIAAPLKVFAGAFTKSTAEIEPQDVKDFLSSLEGYSPVTIGNWRRALLVFFNFCLSRKWCAENPVAAIRPPKMTQAEPQILTPQQAAALLAACDTELLPAVAIGMFCGLRQAELEKLDWSAVNLSEGHITVGAGIAKTNSRRVVTMPENLRAFLRGHSKKTGRVWPEGYRNKWNLARIAAGFGPFFSNDARVKEAIAAAQKAKRKLLPWPNNALRHSCISYRLALEKDLARIAYESGNSPAVIQRHYNGLASPKAAAMFFAIAPEEPENLVKITA
jgi:site-specific recombinase XerD